MRYVVTWTEDAQDQLMLIWIRAPDRRAVTRAQHQIDQLLRRDPESRGIAYYSWRRLEVEPLIVLFQIVEDDRIIYVEQAESTL